MPHTGPPRRNEPGFRARTDRAFNPFTRRTSTGSIFGRSGGAAASGGSARWDRSTSTSSCTSSSLPCACALLLLSSLTPVGAIHPRLHLFSQPPRKRGTRLRNVLDRQRNPPAHVHPRPLDRRTRTTLATPQPKRPR